MCIQKSIQLRKLRRDRNTLRSAIRLLVQQIEQRGYATVENIAVLARATECDMRTGLAIRQLEDQI